jgi:hypothetical protein
MVSGEDRDGEENNKEVQYSPVLLHIEFCCILFGMLDFGRHECCGIDDTPVLRKAKRFLVNVLMNLARDNPIIRWGSI